MPEYFFKVDDSTVFKPFNCNDSDLNDFLFNKSKQYSNELLAITHVLEDDNSTIGYFSIFNDSVRVESLDFASKTKLIKWIKNIVPHGKRHLKEFPAIKIGRLAVTNTLQSKGTGRKFVNYVIDYALRTNEECACKFITVDAYSQSLGFYEKLGFSYFSDEDINEDTRQMYIDLTPLLNSK